MRPSTNLATYLSLLAFGFTANTTAFVIRDLSSSGTEGSLPLVPREDQLRDHCDNESWKIDKNTCVLSASCESKKDNKRVNTQLNLNKCFRFHKNNNANDAKMYPWRVSWNEKDEDRQG